MLLLVSSSLLILHAPLHLLSARTSDAAGEYRNAVQDVKTGRFDEAIVRLRKILQSNPDSLRAQNLLGLAFTGAGQRDAANREFSAILAKDSSFVPALKNLAINEYNSGQSQAAQNHLLKALQLSPGDQIASLYLGEIAAARHDCQQASEYYEAAGKRLQIETGFVLHAAQCLVTQGRGNQAKELLQSLPASSAHAQLQAGILLSDSSEYRAAAHHFEQAQKDSHFSYVAGYDRVLMLIRAGLYTSAVEAARDMKTNGHETAELDELLSDAYRGAGQMQSAYDTLRNAVHLKPDRDSYYAELADICRETGKYDVGFQIIEIGLRRVPSSSSLYVQRALLELATGHMSKSAADLEQAQKLAPNHTIPSLALSVVWMQMGRNKEAISLLRGEVRQHQQDFAAWYLLGKALLRTTSTGSTVPESMAAFRHSIELKADYAPSREALGKLLLDAGKTDKAIHELELAVKIDPSAHAALYQLMLAYRRLGDTGREKKIAAMIRKRNATKLKKTFLNLSLFQPPRSRQVKDNQNGR